MTHIAPVPYMLSTTLGREATDINVCANYFNIKHMFPLNALGYQKTGFLKENNGIWIPISQRIVLKL